MSAQDVGPCPQVDVVFGGHLDDFAGGSRHDLLETGVDYVSLGCPLKQLFSSFGVSLVVPVRGLLDHFQQILL